VKWFQNLPGEVTPGGLLVDRTGRIVVVAENGTIQCFGDARALEETVDHLVKSAADPDVGREAAVASLMNALAQAEHDMELREEVSRQLRKLGYELGVYPRRAGFLTHWYMSGTVPFNTRHPFAEVHVDTKKVDVNTAWVFGGKDMPWRMLATDAPDGRVEPKLMFGDLEGVAIYAYTEFRLDEPMPIKLKLGSDDGFICWLNGEKVGEVDAQRGYLEDEDVMAVQGRQGVNRLLLKVTQDRFGWMFGVRVTDNDDKPLDINKHMP
jgi:hypothetical protein